MEQMENYVELSRLLMKLLLAFLWSFGRRDCLGSVKTFGIAIRFEVCNYRGWILPYYVLKLDDGKKCYATRFFSSHGRGPRVRGRMMGARSVAAGLSRSP